MEARFNLSRPDRFTPGERTTVHVTQEDWWVRNSVWGVQKKRKLLALVGIRTPGHAAS